MQQAHHCVNMGSQYRCARYGSFLEQLQEGAHTFPFTSVDNAERTIQEFRNRGQSEYLFFQDVPYDTFLQLNTHHCRSLHIHDSQILRLQMPSRANENAAAQFALILSRKFTEMGVTRQISAEGSGLMNMGNVSKEADGCWGPVGQDYVTCALEVGMSESLHQFIRDAHIWLESPESHVSQVIIFDIDPQRPRITIQKWEDGVRGFRSIRSDEPLKTEEVEISLVNGVPAASGCLRLSFAKIFERPPQPNTQERDIIFTPNDLTDIARLVWRRQSLIPRHMARNDI